VVDPGKSLCVCVCGGETYSIMEKKRSKPIAHQVVGRSESLTSSNRLDFLSIPMAVEPREIARYVVFVVSTKKHNSKLQCFRSKSMRSKIFEPLAQIAF